MPTSPRRSGARRRTTSPSRDEILACRGYLVRELELLQRVRVVVALGKLAFDNYLAVLKEHGHIASRSGFLFGHGRVEAEAAGRSADRVVSSEPAEYEHG